MLSVGESSVNAMRLYRPKRYTFVFKGGDIEQINHEFLNLNLIYHCTCDNTNANQLAGTIALGCETIKSTLPRFLDGFALREIIPFLNYRLLQGVSPRDFLLFSGDIDLCAAY
jgi:hypothetical protein